jgi:perosamine synthetase
LVSEQLAIFGGRPTLPEQLPEFTPVSAAEVAAATAALRDVPLTTLFGDYEIRAFEEEFAAYCGASFAVAVNSGTSALHAALMAAGIGPGDEVIVTPLSFVASVSTVVHAGATPVYADVDDEFCLDPADVARRITPRTRAILVVHLNGYPADIVPLRKLADEHGLLLIEDAAQAHGARVNDQHVGTFGEFGCFSFNIGKILRTGEGGMVFTASEDSARQLRELRVNGLGADSLGLPVVNRLGFNYTMPQVMAAIGRQQLAHLDEMLKLREEYANLLRGVLAESGAARPLADKPGRKRVWYWPRFVLAPEVAHLRDPIVRALRAENLPANATQGPLYAVPYLHRISPEAHCPNAERLACVSFGIEPQSSFSPASMQAIADGLHKVLANLGRLCDSAVESAA